MGNRTTTRDFFQRRDFFHALDDMFVGLGDECRSERVWGQWAELRWFAPRHEAKH